MSSRSFLKPTDSEADEPRHRCLLMPCFYFAEIPLFVLASVATYTLHFTSTFTPISASYKFDDMSIAMPYVPENDRVMGSSSVYAASIMGPIAIVILVEVVLFGTTMLSNDTKKHAISSAGCVFPLALRRLVRYIGVFTFGYMISTIICDVIQLCSPVAAPYLINVCDVRNQSGEVLNTRDCVSAINGVDIETFLRQFPSYFCTITSYAASFSMIYLRKAMDDAGPAVKTLVTWSPLLFSYILGILEISENVSLPSSVMVGWILGGAVAIFINIRMYTDEEGRLSKVCRRKVLSKNENPFDTGLGSDFMVAEEKDDVGDDYSSKRHVVEECTSFHSPANSRFSQNSEARKSSCVSSPTHSAGISKVERNVIKELQTYIGESDPKAGCESPRPANIRQLAKTGRPQDGYPETQRLTTFHHPVDIGLQIASSHNILQTSSDSSSCTSNSPPPPHPVYAPETTINQLQTGNYVPAVLLDNGMQLHCATYPRKITSIKEESEFFVDSEADSMIAEDEMMLTENHENMHELSSTEYSYNNDDVIRGSPTSGIIYEY